MWWTGVCGVWKSSSHVSSSSTEAHAILPPEWLDRAWDGTLTAEASLGMVLASEEEVALQWHLKGVQEDTFAPQWHLKGIQGDRLQECPTLFPQASVWEQHRELLLDLLLARDALLQPLCVELSLPPLCNASILSWQSQEPSMCSRQWGTSSQPL